MFAYIKGIIDSKGSDSVVLENNGIGYRMTVSLPTIQSVGEPGSEIKLFTYYHVREDNIKLFGFSTIEELKVFEMLITVSGVGPKAAISVVSTLSPSKFSLAVITDDVKALTHAQGVGNKVAQRIILELKDKLRKEQSNTQGNISIGPDIAETGKNDIRYDVVNALMVLGYSALEANKAAASVYKAGMDTETLIKTALKELSIR